MLSLWSPLVAMLFSNSISYVSAAPHRTNCRQFSSNPANEPSMRCEEVDGYPTIVVGSQFDLYHWSHNWNPSVANTYTLGLIPTVAEQVLEKYSQWCQLSSITFMLTNSLPDAHDALAATEHSSDGKRCYVRVLTAQPQSGTLAMEETIAHELYHCTQFCVRPNNMPEASYTNWYIEGTAEYMANYFFPATPADGKYPTSISAQNYDISSPLYRQPDQSTDNGQTAALFFMSLANSGWSPDTIHSWTMNHPFTSGESDERGTLTSDSSISAEFVKFAQRFVDKKILFSNGMPVALSVPIVPDYEDITKDAPITLLWSIPSFTAKLWVVTFAEPGDTIVAAVNTQDKAAVLNYRVQGTTDWFVLSAASPLTITTPCGSTGLIYEFLLTSTVDEDSSIGSIAFAVANKPCPPPVASIPGGGNSTATCSDLGIPIDPCLVGSWTLDDASMQAALLKAEQQVDPAVVVAVSGASTFAITAPHDSVMTFQDTVIRIVAHLAGEELPITTKVTGSVTATVANQGEGKFCWMNAVATGSSSTYFGDDGGDPLVVDMGGYTDPGLVLDYTCSATALSISGVLRGGKTAWTYIYAKEGVA